MVLKKNKNYIISQSNNYAVSRNVTSNLVCGKPVEKLVTIVIPTYNREQLLKESIESALLQNYDDFSVMVVSNNPDSISSMKAIYDNFNDARLSIFVNEENIGVAGNWNRCYQLCQSEWILQLHDDDYLEKNFLKNMMDVIHSTKKIDMLCTAREIVGERHEINRTSEIIKFLKQKIISITGPIIFRLDAEDYLSVSPGSIIGAIMRREKVLELGGFPEEYYPALDKYFLTKFCYNYDAYCVHFEKNLINYRRECNISLNIDVQRMLVLQNKELADYIIEIYGRGKLSRYIAISNLINQSTLLKRTNENQYKLLIADLNDEEINAVSISEKIRKFITLYSVVLIAYNKLKKKRRKN